MQFIVANDYRLAFVSVYGEVTSVRALNVAKRLKLEACHINGAYCSNDAVHLMAGNKNRAAMDVLMVVAVIDEFTELKWANNRKIVLSNTHSKRRKP